MDKKIVYLLFVLLIVGSCSTKKIAFNIKNNIVKDSSYISMEIINPTNKDYYLPIDLFDRNNYDFLKVKEKMLLYPSITISENKKEVLLLGYGSADDRIPNYYLKKEWYLNQFSSVKKITKVSAKSKTVVNFPFYVKLESPYTSSYKWYEVEEGKVYDFEIRYQADKDVVKTVLNKLTLDSLQAMGYELYDKEIISNKVPFTVK
ncbi:hypothetical protein [Flavobacterium sp. '19STA2R22 D10 B1']|uniref:hypothetical protein n=1 Tax=Flavobacterium aerium TaxID=3037261 RepID=UPI00278C663A|nr:hypothetical protein [Flavobacterium sp. '19STA2R22 D10 B1']